MNDLRPPANGDLAEKVAALSRAEFYGERHGRIDRVETHMSWVFLTREYAYKLKKPVCWPHLDFGTLAAREHYCRQEIVLNRRLAASVYLGVVPIRRVRDRLQLGGEAGDIVDYLVKMRRLPAARMLDRSLLAGSVRHSDIQALVSAMANFYRHAERIGFSPASYADRLVDTAEANCRQLCQERYNMPLRRVTGVVKAQLNFIGKSAELASRASHIVDAHGDLRPEHVYLGSPLQVIDCLEFDDRLRELDPLDELSFLALECHRLQAPHVGDEILNLYQEQAADPGSEALIAFYRSHRALVRSMLAIWHLDDPTVADRQKWRTRALLYLDMAEHDTAKFARHQ